MTKSSAQLVLEYNTNNIEALQVPTKAVHAGFQILLSLATSSCRS